MLQTLVIFLKVSLPFWLVINILSVYSLFLFLNMADYTGNNHMNQNATILTFKNVNITEIEITW